MAKEAHVPRRWTAVTNKLQKKYFGENFAIFWSGSDRENRIGLYAIGSCDLPAIFATMPLIRPVLNGTCCVIREGLVAHSRSDVLLQTLQEFPPQQIAEVIEKLQLGVDYFQPRLFEPTFTVPGPDGPQQFPKKLVILSIAGDVMRTLYRHREYGFLVDPGGWWLNQSMEKVLTELSTVSWFRENFVSVGMISVDQFMENFTEIIHLVKNKTGAPVMVFNLPTIDPGSRTHCYQFIKNPQNMRRQEFNLALVALSRKLDFPIVDVDRLLKKAGISDMQMDFAHYPTEAYGLIAQEAYEIMQELKVF
jgi:hypothetical protein